jgi:hypothetical protein
VVVGTDGVYPCGMVPGWSGGRWWLAAGPTLLKARAASRQPLGGRDRRLSRTYPTDNPRIPADPFTYTRQASLVDGCGQTAIGAIR